MGAVIGIDSGEFRARFTAARDDLVSSHLEFARSIALGVAQSLPPSFDCDDLVQSAYLGLLRAATRYRPQDHDGTPFGVFARTHIRGAVLDSVRRPARDAWTESRGGAPLEDAGEPAIAATAEIQCARGEVCRTMRRAIARLQPREQTVLALRYGRDGETFEAIGKRIHVHRSMAQKIHAKALARLREAGDLRNLA